MSSRRPDQTRKSRRKERVPYKKSREGRKKAVTTEMSAVMIAIDNGECSND